MLRLPLLGASTLSGTLVLLFLALMTVSCGIAEHAKEEQSPASVRSAPAPSPSMPATSSWPGVAYLEVRAYYSSEPFSDPFMQGGIPDQVDDKDGALLNRDQERRLISAVIANVGPYEVFGCWYPRHAFVFYDPLGKPVAEVDICFECMIVEGGPSDAPDVGALAELASDLGLPLGVKGMDAEKYRKGFQTWVKEHPRS